MTVTLRCYGGLREAVGTLELAVELPEDATARDVLAVALDEGGSRLPGHVPDPSSLVWRRDGVGIDPDTPVADGDTVSVTDVTMPE